MCREQSLLTTSRELLGGSSPRVRGAELDSGLPQNVGGIIPARAGSSNSTVGSTVVPPAKFGKKVEAAIGDGRRVVLLHNHPASGIPSAADLLAVGGKGCEMGIIAAHDGSIYTFEKVSEPDASYNVDEVKYLRIQRLYGGNEDRLFRAIEERFGFKIEHHE